LAGSLRNAAAYRLAGGLWLPHGRRLGGIYAECRCRETLLRARASQNELLLRCRPGPAMLLGRARVGPRSWLPLRCEL
jgi:hypothetical protein